MPRALLALLVSLGLWSAAALAAEPIATRSLAAAYGGRLKIGAAIEPDQLAGPDGRCWRSSSAAWWPRTP
ncbi:hypothetical protein PPL19_00605 [Pseudomonas psychrotolerans L19]|uniref:hypothetical protein n=1 Tax=Pseudomonas TaxID=286 RepID=UPI00023A3D7F|nr:MULTISPECIES: hypothetical protein [Pseudomonas]EHK72700.1 hypothetical protein PPL19_00605 [Pseudomonas psychrotolerans L19]MBA1179202.1 hypothetical protein [Pseudomonas psychrotolerans]MBA1211810.1 hypothetical protein [Pseudomonas psychrotolerans]TCQ92347.1 hypothetical protein EC839_102134 [Pseudomonas sp. JUb52]